MKILVVDNDNDTGITLKALLGSYPDIYIELAFSGKTAIQELMLNNRYDAVIIDIMMPEFSGLDVARMMGKNDKLKNIPIILMSSALPLPPTELLATMRTDPEMQSVKGVIEKPFIIESVVEVINQVVNPKEA